MARIDRVYMLVHHIVFCLIVFKYSNCIVWFKFYLPVATHGL
jgi:hypothetical protein